VCHSSVGTMGSTSAVAHREWDNSGDATTAQWCSDAGEVAPKAQRAVPRQVALLDLHIGIERL
jgi:hypothetical protein